MIAAESPVEAVPCAAAVGNGRTRLIRSMADLDRLQCSWETLVSGDPLSGFAYARAWAATLGPAESLHILVHEGDQPLAIAPLVLKQGGCGWLTQLAFETYEILDLPCRDSSSAFALATAIHQSGRPLFLNRVPWDSPIVKAIVEVYRGRGWVIQKKAIGAPYIPLDASWQQPESHLNSGRRSDMRRARRHAAENGEVEFDIHSPAAAELPGMMDEVFRVEAAGWKAATGTALAVDSGLRSFYQQYAALAQKQGTLRICFFKIGGRAVAAQLAIETLDRFSLLKVGYDEEYARCSPGQLLTIETIRYAAERGLRSYDFNGKVERWTDLWTHEERRCCSIRAYPLSLRGCSALALGGWRAARRKLPWLKL